MRTILYSLPLALLAFFIPLDAFASNVTFFGPLVPEACHSCPCGFAGVMQIIANSMNLAISISLIIGTLIIAAGGFMYIMSAANPESRSTANKMLMNAVIGLLIVLSAWLIVDFVMKSLYGGQFGPWNEILRGGEECIVAREMKPLFSGDIITQVIDGVTATPGQGDTGTGGGGSNCGVDGSSMVAFPAEATSGGGEKATASTVKNFLAMREAAAKDGVSLKVTDGFRPDSEQVALWNQHCSSGTCGATKVAKPCSMGGTGSNHGSGQALDISVGCGNGNSGCNTKTYNWLKANGSKWGFRNALPTDPVHWSPSGR